MGTISRIVLHKKTILMISTATVVAVILTAAVFIWLERPAKLRIPTMGNLKTSGVEAYWNKELTNRTGLVNWGTVWLGASQNISIYLKSISNIKTSLDLASENWTFWKSNNGMVAEPTQMMPYMNLTWNYNNTIVQPGEVLQVTLTLSVDRNSDFIDFLIMNDVRSFSVDIMISTSE